MKEERVIKKVFVICFLIIISFFMITTLFNNNKISNLEKRSLTTFPKITVKKLLTKDYYDDLTEAFNDQLELRNYLIKGYFLLQFQKYYGDAVIGKNNQLYSPVQNDLSNNNYNNLAKAILNVNSESKKINAKFIFISIPRKDAYMTKDLPKNYKSSLNIYQKQVEIVENNLDKNIIFIDAYKVFDKSNIYNCYYSNDHHITPKCAYLLYKEINKYTKTETYNLEDMFDIKKTVINGAYNRQLGGKVKSKMEDLFLVPKVKINYKRYENDKISNKKVYDQGNTYEDAYMEGDMVYTRIERNINGENIMYVGSSFTNILEALSVPSYNRVLSIDYRHNKKGEDISYYVDKYDIDYVVFMPSQSNNALGADRINLYLNK